MAGEPAPENDPKDPPDPKDPDPKDPPDDDNDDGNDPDDDDVEKWKALARKHERSAKRSKAEADKLRKQGLSDQEKAIEEAKEEARAEARAEAVAENVSITLDAVATAKLADPTFVRLIDDETREDFVADGKVDRKAIEKAVDALVKKYPNLAKAGSKPGSLPGGDQTQRSSTNTMNDLIRGKIGRG